MAFELSSFYAYKSINLKSDSNNQFVVIGHSHPECAYNDALIQNMVNIAQSREPYFYTYLKLYKFLEQNRNINTVFVEFTNNNISASMDDWIFANSDIEHKFVRYASFISLEEMGILFKGNKTEFLHRLPETLKRNFSFILNHRRNFLDDFGGHLEVDHKLEPELLEVKDSVNAIEQSHLVDISEINIEYLKKMIALCQDRQIEIVLIRTPFHPLYLLNKNQDLYSEYLNNDFKDVKYLDFSGFQLELNELADTQHLNKYGAERYSKWFNEFLKLGRLNQSTVDSLIQIENARLEALDDSID